MGALVMFASVTEEGIIALRLPPTPFWTKMFFVFFSLRGSSTASLHLVTGFLSYHV